MNQPPPNPQNALRRLLIVLVIVLGFMIYSYGWTVTDINLARPQEPQRQQNVTNALRELLSPNIFEQDRNVVNIYANFRVECGEPVEQPAEEPEGAEVSVTPDCGEPGDVIEISVRGFTPLAEGRVRWSPPGEDAQIRPRNILETGREELVFDTTGGFSGTIEVPLVRGSEGQISQIVVQAAVPIGAVRFSDTSNLVVERMAETIFMALVATSISIPIAVMLSFFAARNLMKPIKLSVGGMLVAFVAFALGIWIGIELLKPLADLGVDIGRGDEMGDLMALIVPVVVVFGTVGASRVALNGVGTPQHQPSPVERARTYVVRLVMGAVIIFLVGTLGGLLLLGGEAIIDLADGLRPDESGVMTIVADGIGGVGYLLRVVGELISLTTAGIAGLISAFVISGVATDVLAAPLRHVAPVLSHSLGGILGALSGAILLGALGTFGMWAALLGLLSPIAAAVMGGNALVMIYRTFIGRDRSKQQFELSQLDNAIYQVLFIIGAVAAFAFTFEYLSVGRAMIDGTLPPTSETTFLGIQLPVYIRDNMIIGLILGAVGGAVAGTRSNFPAGSILYNVSRTLLNTVRSIEPLIMGLVFVIWVGIGPFAGVLALTLHSIASLGKLYSEQIENIDEGPVEALESTGANRLQTIVYAVVPQIVPPYIAFTMYRWDINVRMSTIIGFVGGGGIGLLLQQQINLLRYREAGVAVLAIAVVVSILDYASASIRARIG